jgi:hypothetical protein
MKKYLFLMAALLSLFTFTACNEEETTCEFYIGTTENPAVEQWTLWLDGQNMGILPNPEQEASCDNLNGGRDSLIHLTLSSARHNFEAIDASGIVRSRGYFKSSEQKSTVGGRLGGASSDGSCACNILYIFD